MVDDGSMMVVCLVNVAKFSPWLDLGGLISRDSAGFSGYATVAIFVYASSLVDVLMHLDSALLVIRCHKCVPRIHSVVGLRWLGWNIVAMSRRLQF